nr:MAG TPA: hypothetical protein [Caudoviricetes sp.]
MENCIYNTGGYCYLYEETCAFVGIEEECLDAQEG